MKDVKDREFYIEKAMDENYGIFLKTSGMYLGWKSLSVLYISLAALHIICLGYTAYLCFDDLGIMSEAVHFCVLLGTAITSMINSLYYRPKIDYIFENIGRGFYDYENTLDDVCMEEIKKMKEKGQKRKKYLVVLFVSGIFSTGFAISVFRPMLEYIFLPSPPNPGDNVNRYIAVSCWYPYLNPEITWQNLTSFFLQYLLIAMTPGVVFGTDVTFLCMGEEFSMQLQIICLTLTRCNERAVYMCRKNIKTTKEEFEDKLVQCIRHSIKHHHAIIKMFQEYKELNFLVLLWFMVGSSFLLCLSGLIFVTSDVGLFSKLTFFLFLTLESTHAFIFCWYGEEIERWSLKLGQSIYNSPWIDTSLRMKYFILIVDARCLVPLKLSAGGFMSVNLSTYGNVLSSSYSYFNLLRAVK